MEAQQYPRASDCVSQRDKPLDFLHGFMARRVYYKDISDTPKEAKLRADLPRSATEWMQSAGFCHVGAYQEGLSGFMSPKLPRVAFVAPAKIVRLTMNKNMSRQWKRRGKLLYSFYTFFADDSAVVTWCEENPRTKTEQRLISQGSRGSLAADYEQHCLAVDRRISDGAMPLRIETITDIKATYFYYFRRVSPRTNIRLAFVLWLQMRGFLYLIPLLLLIHYLKPYL